MGFRGPRVRLWRWRRSPLRRRCDVVEAWAVLGVWLVTVLAGVVAGWTAARSAADGLARERTAWRPTTALVTQRAPSPPTADPEAVVGQNGQVWAKVRWNAPDGSPHAGQARVRPGSAVGTRVTVWTDDRGRLTTRPATPAEARTRSVVVGVLAGAGAALVPCAAGRLLRARLERRRMDRWDAEWARFGPLWSRKTW
ncbi:Rv1733c family protein [Streptomyces mexicanus]|uniref:Rv1733c family protein n=1 Tax=Streptomyces mexicanus TaxID=178566 RepID=UPI00364C41DD